MKTVINLDWLSPLTKAAVLNDIGDVEDDDEQADRVYAKVSASLSEDVGEELLDYHLEAAEAGMQVSRSKLTQWQAEWEYMKKQSPALSALPDEEE